MKSLLNLALVMLLGLTLTACNLPGSSSDSGEPTASAQYDNSDYVGLSVPNAQAKAKAADVSFRLVEIDGEPQATTRDFRPGGINAKVERGVITEYSVEGQE